MSNYTHRESCPSTVLVHRLIFATLSHPPQFYLILTYLVEFVPYMGLSPRRSYKNTILQLIAPFSSLKNSMNPKLADFLSSQRVTLGFFTHKVIRMDFPGLITIGYFIKYLVPLFPAFNYCYNAHPPPSNATMSTIIDSVNVFLLYPTKPTLFISTFSCLL